MILLNFIDCFKIPFYVGHIITDLQLSQVITYLAAVLLIFEILTIISQHLRRLKKIMLNSE